HRLSLVIGDACGRGREAAPLLRTLFPRLQALSNGTARPSRLLQLLNRELFGEIPSDRFITGTALEIDARAGTLTIANAGHVPAVLRTRCGRVTVIGHASGPPLGLIEHSQYRDDSFRIQRGDLMVFMTDGVLEAVEDDLSRMSTLRELVANAPAGGKAVQRSLLTEFEHSQVSKRLHDDATLLSLEILSAPTPLRSRTLAFATLH
ncbi:MAG TPA: PP2C family protein-serine/threonine phosphatase, partial [Polyangiaceae bacterium]|nr:PP2C family protein-serine/threonine phosphatase [Polyangiaceae bacterium]